MPRLAVLAATAIGPLIMVAWSAIYPISCVSMILPVAVIAILTLRIREKAVKRRACLAHCYFREGSFIYRMIRSGILITLYAIVVSTVLTTALMVSLIAWTDAMIALMVADALVIAFLYLAFTRLSEKTFRVREAFASVFAKDWTVGIGAPLLLGGLVIIQYHSPIPAYIQPDDLRTTVQAASSSVQSQCPIVNTLAKLNLEKEGFSWWLMIKGARSIEDVSLEWTAWFLFLISGGLSVWAYSYFCVQVIDSAYRMRERQ